jgi:hypothetical protein
VIECENVCVNECESKIKKILLQKIQALFIITGASIFSEMFGISKRYYFNFESFSHVLKPEVTPQGLASFLMVFRNNIFRNNYRYNNFRYDYN